MTCASTAAAMPSTATPSTPSTITSFGIVGTPAQVVDRLVALNGLGLHRVMILGGFAGASEEAAAHLAVSREVLAREVFPAVREKLG